MLTSTLLALALASGPTGINSETIVHEREISLSSYDLTQSQDVKRLEQRLMAAARQVCPVQATYLQEGGRAACLDQAETMAQSQLDQHVRHAELNQERRRQLAQNER